MNDKQAKQAECQHIWQYDGKQGHDLWMMCPKCGQTRMIGPYDPVPMMVAKELNIRHDSEDGDV